MSEKNDYTIIEKCQVCSGSDLRDILDLGLDPGCNCITQDDVRNGREHLWPLVICYCRNCWCVQSRYIVDPRILFGVDYQHIAGIPASFRKNVKELASSLMNRFDLTSKDLVIDIGSNDGSLLEEFVSSRIRVLGVDPSGAAEITIEKGIPTVNDFFDESCAREILQNYGKARVITALNTFAHVAALESFMKGVKALLDERGLFVTESHYLLDLVQKLQYDFAYHEHLRHYSLRTLNYLFGMFDMEIFDVKRIPTHGGSIRVFSSKKGVYPISGNVKELLELEVASGLFSDDTYKQFAIRAEQQRLKLRQILSDVKKSGKRLVAMTYPCRGITLMQYCGIGSNFIEYISDNTPSKIGKYMPGTHLKIVDQKFLFEDQPDYGLLLSWHLSEEIIPKFRAMGFKGKFIIPLPDPEIL